ncbi:hypothetical protein FBU59_002472 [Linderina macrospora]|uniref:Uncharacterized protein n=1 Tax=Linderina macrospora TaxID=4868 RepID=A0ACC1JBC9_9FUNG|nr:hypothetical protein FBU59_002472 [Linderina macrospora]
MSDDIIQRTEELVREYMSKYDCSHDWFHVQRVVRQALALAAIESKSRTVDVLVVHLAALLHDVDDAKYRKADETPFSMESFLVGAGLDSARASLVCRIVDGVSFRKELLAMEHDRLGTSTEDERMFRTTCVELACVQDADRLDAIGAFGILRCAAFSGARNRTLHDPKDVALQDITYEEYVKQSDGTTGTAIAHFHEKLLKLAGMMKTEAAKQEAKDRNAHMLEFLAQLQKEYDFGSPL